MLSDPDARVVQLDRSLPGLALLLDPDALMEELRAHLPHADLGRATAHYLRYKPFTNCLVAYRLSTPAGEHEVYAKAHPLSASKKIEKARTRASVPEALGIGRMALDNFAVVVAAFPNDDKLRILRTWHDADRRRRLLHRVVRGSRITHAGSQVLRYKPERRIVARIEDIDGRLMVLRGSLPADFAQSAAGAASFESRGPLKIARCLGVSPRDSAVALEWLPGRELAGVIADDDVRSSTMATVGSALAELHAQRVEGLPTNTLDEESRQLAAVADSVAFLCPEIADRVQTLRSRILANLSPSQLRPIHGDFHARQVVLSGGAAGFIDFDEAAIGDPAIDIATFLAHLERDALAGRLSRGRLEMCVDGLMEGYRTVSSTLPLGGLPARIAGGLLLLAPHPFRDREPRWKENTASIVSRALEILDRAAIGPSPLKAPVGALPPLFDRDTARVSDRFDIARDPALPFAAAALDPVAVERHLAGLPRLRALGNDARVARIRVTRYRSRRRCVIEYTMRASVDPHHTFKILGKMHHRGVDRASYRILEVLREHGFDDNSADGVAVPEPLGVVPDLRMWFQTCAEGRPATALLSEPSGTPLGRRIAAAVWKLHTCGVRMSRRHTLDDELAILRRRLEEVATAQPERSSRLARVFDACESLAASIGPMPDALIHRDFYPDQVLIHGQRVWLLDFDLCCMGDPALDAGNFIGHIIEQGLRASGSADILAQASAAFREQFLQLAGRERAEAVDAYTTLTLARHIWISTQLPDRRAFTGGLLGLCESRLGLPSAADHVVTEMSS